MWESLATTRGQDRALHGAAKALNVARRPLRDPGLADRAAARRAACAGPCSSAPSTSRCPSRAAGERSMERADGRAGGDPPPASAQRLGRDAQGPARPDQLRARPDPPGPRRRLLLSGSVQRRVVRRRRRRAHRRPASPSIPSRARPGRRPRPLLLAPLRLRPRDRRPRLLRVGLQRLRDRPAQLRRHRLPLARALDRRLEGGRGHRLRRALPQGVGLDHGRRARASRSAAPRCSGPATSRAPRRRSTAA